MSPVVMNRRLKPSGPVSRVSGEPGIVGRIIISRSTSEFDQFELPFCNGHILVPDPGYGAPVVFLNKVLGLGFRFREGTCSMHCYTVEDARLGATQTLTEVAEALVSNVDAPLRAYAATIPVNQR